MHYKFLGRNYAMDGTALAFSPDGSIVYIASNEQEVYAYVSAGDNKIPSMWSTAAADNDLCDIVVSPSGLSVSRKALAITRVHANVSDVC